MKVVDSTGIMKRELLGEERLDKCYEYVEDSILQFKKYLDVLISSCREETGGESDKECAEWLDLHVCGCAHSNTSSKSGILDMFFQRDKNIFKKLLKLEVEYEITIMKSFDFLRKL